jgi:glycosyltransferase involved in cell wall biosynthesis/peptidoglycan/xylan/chitin deacetylase (PgdA/CDA1 family)
MGAAARRRAEDFGWSTVARSYEQLYRRLAGETARREPKSAGESERPKISVIIPARDAAATLERTINSLRRQRYGEWEAIVIDDGSRDATPSIAKHASRRDRRIRLRRSRATPRAWVGRKATGVSVARNQGVRVARHDWLVFLDADDELDERYFERMTDLLRAQPDTDVAFCGSKRVSPSGTASIEEFFPDANKMFETLARRSAFPIHACMVRRARFDALGGFDPDLSSCEDWDLWQRMARAGARFSGLAEPLALYRVRPGSKSMSGIEMLAAGLRVLERGNGPDPRVHDPRPDYANGYGDRLEADRFYFTCWCAGLELGGARDARPLLAGLAPHPDLDPDGVARNLFYSAILPSGRTAAEWTALMPIVRHEMEAFLETLERVAAARGLARRSQLALEDLMIEHAAPGDLGLIGRTYCMTVDVSRPLPNSRFHRSVERFRCAVALDGRTLGAVELPVFDGFVGSAVLADAIAAEFGWLLLRLFFARSVYDDVRIERGPRGVSLWRGDALLYEGDLDAWTEGVDDLHDQVGWIVFLQELWGSPDLPEAALTSLPHPEVVDHVWIGGETASRPSTTWKRIAVGMPLADVPADEDSFLVPTVGGSPLGFALPPQGRPLPAAEIRSLITVLGGFELCTLAVREAVLGRPFDAVPGTLNRRLRAAAGTSEASGSITSRQMNPPPGICVAEFEVATRSPFPASGAGPGILLARRPAAIRVDAYARRAHLPVAALDALLEAARTGGESVVGVGRAEDHPTFVAYDPALLWVREPGHDPRPQKPEDRLGKGVIGAESEGPPATFTDALPILAYSLVAPDTGQTSLAPSVAPSTFESQLAFLEEAGYHTVTIAEWLRATHDRCPLPGRAVMLTFDGGCVDFLTRAWPSLQRFGFSPVLFLRTDEISEARTDGALPSRRTRVDWGEVRRLRSEGVDVQALGSGTDPLPGLAPQAAVASAARARAILQDRLGCRIHALAYPHGAVDRATEHIVGACGYAMGMTIVPQRATVWHRPLAQPRIPISGRDSLDDFVAKLGDAPLAVRRRRVP